MSGIAKACGYKNIYKVETEKDLEKIMNDINESFKNGKNELTFLEVKVTKGARKDLGRPTTTPQENKKALMEFLND